MVRYWGTSIALFTAEGNGMLQGHTPVRWLSCFIALWSRIYGGCTSLYLMGFYKPTPRYFNIILKYIIYTHKHPSIHPFIHPCVHVCMHTHRRTYDMYCIYRLYIYTYIYIYVLIDWFDLICFDLICFDWLIDWLYVYVHTYVCKYVYGYANVM
jgi:hypothetical protein